MTYSILNVIDHVRTAAMRREMKRSRPLSASPAAAKASALPKRRARIVIKRKRKGHQDAPSNVSSSSVVSNLPTNLPVLRDEVAILRAHLSHEIDQILFGEQ
ncbi:hypothetical protein [Altererythrobacter lauratis]|uniref:Uncharacterized protein n=1 Tax=Alteraurantiacibacter lauratis TaxID=2054627 RepID=A0ABV7EGQ6_9SPHN